MEAATLGKGKRVRKQVRRNGEREREGEEREREGEEREERERERRESYGVGRKREWTKL